MLVALTNHRAAFAESRPIFIEHAGIRQQCRPTKLCDKTSADISCHTNDFCRPILSADNIGRQISLIWHWLNKLWPQQMVTTHVISSRSKLYHNIKISNRTSLDSFVIQYNLYIASIFIYCHTNAFVICAIKELLTYLLIRDEFWSNIWRGILWRQKSQKSEELKYFCQTVNNTTNNCI